MKIYDEKALVNEFYQDVFQRFKEDFHKFPKLTVDQYIASMSNSVHQQFVSDVSNGKYDDNEAKILKHHANPLHVNKTLKKYAVETVELQPFELKEKIGDILEKLYKEEKELIQYEKAQVVVTNSISSHRQKQPAQAGLTEEEIFRQKNQEELARLKAGRAIKAMTGQEANKENLDAVISKKSTSSKVSDKDTSKGKGKGQGI